MAPIINSMGTRVTCVSAWFPSRSALTTVCQHGGTNVPTSTYLRTSALGGKRTYTKPREFNKDRLPSPVS